MNVLFFFPVEVTLDLSFPTFFMSFGWKFLGMPDAAKPLSSPRARRCVVGWQDCRKLLKLRSSNHRKPKRREVNMQVPCWVPTFFNVPA